MLDGCLATCVTQLQTVLLKISVAGYRGFDGNLEELRSASSAMNRSWWKRLV